MISSSVFSCLLHNYINIQHIIGHFPESAHAGSMWNVKYRAMTLHKKNILFSNAKCSVKIQDDCIFFSRVDYVPEVQLIV